MAAVDDLVSAAQAHLDDLKTQGADKFGGAPGAYDQAVSQAQQALNAAVRAQTAAGKPTAPVKLSPGQSLLNDDGSVKYTAPGKPEKPVAPLKLSPGQSAYGPDGSVIATAPAKTDSAAQTTSAQGRLDSGQAALDRAGAYAGWTQARIDAAKQGAWAKVQPQLDAIDAQVLAGTVTKEDGEAAKQGLVQNAISDTVTGMTAPQRSTAAYQAASTAASEGNSRASDAASIYDNQTSQANDAAQHGSFVAGSVLGNRLAAAPAFQASMGGAPLLTDAQKAEIGQHLLNGGSRDDALAMIAHGHAANMAGTSFDPNGGDTPIGQPEGQPATNPGHRVGPSFSAAPVATPVGVVTPMRSSTPPNQYANMGPAAGFVGV